jgi:Tat protein translocase TatB subunit
VLLLESAFVFNITGGEVIIIAIVALVILGPDKLPDFVRRAGRLYGEVKKISNGFKTEFRDVIEEPVREMQDTVNLAKSWFDEGKTAVGTMDDLGWNTPMTPDPADTKAPTPSAATASAAASNEEGDPGPDASESPSPANRGPLHDPFNPAPVEPVDEVDETYVLDSGDESGEGMDDGGFDDADDDPNFYDEFGNMITSSDVEGRNDRFGGMSDRRSGEGTDA